MSPSRIAQEKKGKLAESTRTHINKNKFVRLNKRHATVKDLFHIIDRKKNWQREREADIKRKRIMSPTLAPEFKFDFND